MFKVVYPQKLDLRQKNNNYAFNSRNITIEGLI